MTWLWELDHNSLLQAAVVIGWAALAWMGYRLARWVRG